MKNKQKNISSAITLQGMLSALPYLKIDLYLDHCFC